MEDVMKTLFITFLLVLTISLLAKPASLPLAYKNSIDLITEEVQTELYSFVLYNQNDQQPSSIAFSEADFGSATLEVYDILGKQLFSATVYLSESRSDYILNNSISSSPDSNPVILLVKLTTQDNQYLKKVTLFI